MSPFLDKLQTSGVVAQPEHDSMRQALESRYAKQKEGWAFCPQADGTVAATATTCDAQGSKLTKGQHGPMLRWRRRRRGRAAHGRRSRFRPWRGVPAGSRQREVASSAVVGGSDHWVLRR